MSYELRWIGASNGDFPDGAVIGCKEHSFAAIIARAWHAGSLIPGKLLSNDKICYISYGGKEHNKNVYEVLCNAKVNWVKVSSNGCIPPKALAAGHEVNGETLYIGRAKHEGTLVLGKVSPSHRQCYVAYYGKEFGYSDYEILVTD